MKLMVILTLYENFKLSFYYLELALVTKQV